jgi:hypothetical protein
LSLRDKTYKMFEVLGGENLTTFKQYFDGDVVGDANPFSRRDKGGQTEWKSGNQKLKLIFGRFISNDGWVALKVKSGFKVTFKVVSSDSVAFNSVGASYDNQGYKSSRINAYSSGLGGDSILELSLLGGDSIQISDAVGITLNLRRDEGIDAGSWMTTDSLSSTADITVKMKEVIRYTETTGDWEGHLWSDEPEESERVVENPDDPLGTADTPINTDYHPTTDESLGTNPFQDQLSPMMGVLYSVLVVAVLGSLWGRGG